MGNAHSRTAGGIELSSGKDLHHAVQPLPVQPHRSLPKSRFQSSVQLVLGADNGHLVSQGSQGEVAEEVLHEDDQHADKAPDLLGPGQPAAMHQQDADNNSADEGEGQSLK